MTWPGHWRTVWPVGQITTRRPADLRGVSTSAIVLRATAKLGVLHAGSGVMAAELALRSLRASLRYQADSLRGRPGTERMRRLRAYPPRRPTAPGPEHPLGQALGLRQSR